MPSDHFEEPRWHVTNLGRQMLGGDGPALRYSRLAPHGCSRVVLNSGVFLPNYDRGEPGGSSFDRMPDYEGQSQER